MRSSAGVVLVTVCLFLLDAPGSSLASPEAEWLEGTASWDFDLLAEWARQKYGVTIEPEPKPVPNQRMLDDLNPEFLTRIKALLSIHQALGGKTAGGINRDGSLRTPEEQHQIYADCRFNKTVRATILDDPWLWLSSIDWSATKKEDWTEIPKNLRNSKNCPHGAPPTQAWVSWHNLGLAVDFGLAHDKLFIRMMDAAGELGMIPGKWWGYVPGAVEFEPYDCDFFRERGREGKEVLVPRVVPERLGWDPSHVEWHPWFNGVPENHPGAIPGKALRDDQIQPGYRWKLPARIYQAHVMPYETGLSVYELQAEGGWIGLKKMRRVSRNQGGGVLASWKTFDPPIRLFPVYIPTMEFWRGSERPEDRTSVTFERYDGYEGSKAARHQRRTGVLEYTLRLTMSDLQKRVNQYIGSSSGDEKKRLRKIYRKLWTTSIYEVSVVVDCPRDSAAGGEGYRWEGRDIDTEGYTKDYEGQGSGCVDSGFGFHMAWNRDEGKVGNIGTLDLNQSLNPDGTWDLVEEHEGWGEPGSGQRFILSSRLPEGIQDMESHPWPGPNPKPETPPAKEEEGAVFLPR